MTEGLLPAKKRPGRAIAAAAVCFALAAAAILLWMRQAPPRNVIIISLDTLRADHVGTYGYKRNTTPNMDIFAEEGIVMERAFAQAPYTLSSQASVHTSQYPSVHGTRQLSDRLPSEKETLAEVLREAGYTTAAFVGGGEVERKFGFAQGFDTFIDSAGVTMRNTIPLAEAWLEKRERGTPFFLFLQGYDVHGPYNRGPHQLNSHFDDAYRGVLESHTDFVLDYQENVPNAILHKIFKREGGKIVLERDGEDIPLSDRDIEHIIAHYDGGIAYADQFVGRFLSFLKEQGLYEDSLIIIMAAHGESLAEDAARPYVEEGRLFGHGQLQEELVHVPLLIRDPRLEPARVSEKVELIDLYPTILDMVGVPLSDRIRNTPQGKSFSKLLRGAAGGRDLVFGEAGNNAEMKYAREDRWKLIQSGGEEVLLFDVREDPREINNVASAYPAEVERLKNALFEWNVRNIQYQSQ